MFLIYKSYKKKQNIGHDRDLFKISYHLQIRINYFILGVFLL